MTGILSYNKRVILFIFLTFSALNGFAAMEETSSPAPLLKRPILNYIRDRDDPLKSHEWLMAHPSFKKGQDFLKALRTNQTTPPPQKYDIRDVYKEKGITWFSVYDQRNIGSCTANAVAGAMEFDLFKAQLKPAAPPILFNVYFCILTPGY